MSTPRIASLPLNTGKYPRAASMLQRLLSQHLRAGSLELRTPNGETWHFDGVEDGPRAQWQIHDWRVMRYVLQDGDVGLGRAYFEGLWDSPDPAQLIALALHNRHAVESWIQGSWWRRRFFWLLDQFRPNTRRGSRRNIAEHYDLGNDFYQLWLDPSMSYSSACFDDNRHEELSHAQERKYALALESLALPKDSQILEIGCGWGGFAEYAARQGYRVHGITLSREQLRYAEARIRNAGLSERVELEYCDYRDVKGLYDGIVSIEMFEAVGREWWPTYFRRLNSLLRAGGRVLLQTIHITDAQYPQYCRGSDFIRRYVFPGGFLPSPTALREELRKARLQVLGEHQFGQDYARTLRAWRTKFDAETEALAQLGYDHTFQRLWRFYLAYCEGGFLEGSIGVGQWTLAHG
ncbi:cyclopropane-fatty-acyl-phospholipid synthase family protein [Acidithiobacillus sp. AMEEHan]|uniref:cyclopropane-fatty-acyl-phospholipid synthase family protein n=1 Tax=Acidithiobacillus sp. AMEEHan TaxID=2994951 RepID=UPI0027E54A1C|nr:cyclopropane-fatty-acyl-phospholipid synthase family protein [Acidithiobacillus sp. AMEEHan]